MNEDEWDSFFANFRKVFFTSRIIIVLMLIARSSSPSKLIARTFFLPFTFDFLICINLNFYESLPVSGTRAENSSSPVPFNVIFFLQKWSLLVSLHKGGMRMIECYLNCLDSILYVLRLCPPPPSPAEKSGCWLKKTEILNDLFNL